jgi:integrase
MARRKPSIIYQTLQRLDELKRFGESKHLAKQEERERCIEKGERYNPARVEGIFSHKTYQVYKEHCLKFVSWARETHGVKNLERAREYVKEYLEKHIGEGRSAWTVRVEASALAKLYGCQSTDFGVKLPERRREDIHRSREEREHDRKFSEERNRDLVEFCKATGLRRKELLRLQARDIIERDGVVFIHVHQGKGGRERVVQVVEEYRDHVLALKQRAESEGREKVFERIPVRADIHSYRREYAANRYKEIERDPEQYKKARERWEEYKRERGCEGPDTYRRRDGREFDRAILLEVSRDMGHNRVDVIARHYLD